MYIGEGRHEITGSSHAVCHRTNPLRAVRAAIAVAHVGARRRRAPEREWGSCARARVVGAQRERRCSRRSSWCAARPRRGLARHRVRARRLAPVRLSRRRLAERRVAHGTHPQPLRCARADAVMPGRSACARGTRANQLPRGRAVDGERGGDQRPGDGACDGEGGAHRRCGALLRGMARVALRGSAAARRDHRRDPRHPRHLRLSAPRTSAHLRTRARAGHARAADARAA